MISSQLERVNPIQLRFITNQVRLVSDFSAMNYSTFSCLFKSIAQIEKLSCR